MWPATPPTIAPLMQPLASAPETDTAERATMQAVARTHFMLSSDYETQKNNAPQRRWFPEGGANDWQLPSDHDAVEIRRYPACREDPRRLGQYLFLGVGQAALRRSQPRAQPLSPR